MIFKAGYPGRCAWHSLSKGDSEDIGATLPGVGTMVLEDLYRLLKAGHVQAQGVVDTMSQAVVVLDRNLCVTTANNAFVKTFRVDRDEVIGTNFFDLGNGRRSDPEGGGGRRLRGETRFSVDRTENLSGRCASPGASGRQQFKHSRHLRRCHRAPAPGRRKGLHHIRDAPQDGEPLRGRPSHRRADGDAGPYGRRIPR